MSDTLVTLITIKLIDGHHRTLTNVKSWKITADGNFLVVERITGLDDLVVTKLDHWLLEDMETVLINQDLIAEVSVIPQVTKPSKVVPIKTTRLY